MATKKYKATIALIASAAGCVAAYPYSSGFVGGMLQHGFMAAMVGGLADWFAVTALFRKPLGISYRTEVIPRNRERIFGELVDFVSQDLLNTSNIMKVMEKYDTSEMLLAYLKENNGVERVQEFAGAVAAELIKNIDADEIGASVENIISTGMSKVKLTDKLADVLRWSVNNNYDDVAIDFLLSEVERIVRQDEMHELLANLIEQAKESYTGDDSKRRIVGMLANLSSAKLADAACKEIFAYLEKMHAPEHRVRIVIKQWLLDKIEQLRSSEAAAEYIMKQLDVIVRDKLLLKDRIRQLLDSQLEKQELNQPTPLDKLIEDKTVQLENDFEMQNRVDNKIKGWLRNGIDAEHRLIVRIVQEKLQRFSNEALVGFIEERVGDDLQMIRINGSLVGGLVGILLYLLTSAVERMCV